MILSMLKLSRADCNALNIKDIYSIHKVIYSLFPQPDNENTQQQKEEQPYGNKPHTDKAEKLSSRDFLFVDKGGDFHAREILILSLSQPALPEYGEISSKIIPESFLQMDNYGFEVVLNPVKRDNKSGKLISVRGRQNLLQWFIDKTEKGELGFTVDSKTLQVNREGVLRYQKNGATCTHNTATFKGKLKVTDRSKFIQTFEKGIGRAKGFGFGLLQIVPITI
ncbi:MAG: type I-E CRISPR-associated protein Cas6/Cse3/CasE [Desulfamplus sp.]|nr:type I-E CRISPR-associated protein Cas6/Cse3/CasE [Desulfamplus sp.]